MNYKKYYDLMNNHWFSGKDIKKNIWAKFLPKEQKITPSSIIEKMIDNANIDWTNPNLKICDPCCGSGRFLIYCLMKLLKAGHSEKHIIENMLYGTDINGKCVNFISVFWKFNCYNHNIGCSSILSENWSFNNMKFDLIIMNPPYKIGGKITKVALSCLKDDGILINLMPLMQYKKDLFKYIKDFELANNRLFSDAAIGSNLNISILKKKEVNKYTWDSLLFASFNQDYIKFYEWNRDHNVGLAMVRADGKNYNEFNIDTDFVETMRCYSTASGGYDNTSTGYKFNVLKSGYQSNWIGLIGVIHFPSKKAKDNFCKYWYQGKWKSLSSKVIYGVNSISAGSTWYMSIPQIDWDTIDTNPLWIAGQYDDAVLDTMGLKWDINKEKILMK